jgi:predicted nucleotidyltransferase
MEEMLESIKNEILKTTRDVELIFVFGSCARGTMHEHSDIDVRVLTKTKPAKKDGFSFVNYHGKKILLTLHFGTFSQVKSCFRDPKSWVWEYESVKHAKVLFDKDDNMRKLQTELDKHQFTSKDFLQFVPTEASALLEYVGKMRHASSEKDELNILYAARTIAEICYNILTPFNAIWKYKSESETYPSFIRLENKPTHYFEDFKICHGLTLKKRTNQMLFDSAMRLARETASFLRKNLDQTAIDDREFLRFFNSKEYRDSLR